MKLVYNVNDKPKFGQILVFALQQLLAIMAATIVVPRIIGNGMSEVAALFGAGVGTLVYLLFTKFKSPVFLGSSFAFLSSMAAAFTGAITVAAGYAGLIIGAALAGLTYVVFALIIKACGTGWVNKLLPPVVIGPTVAIIGLVLAGPAIQDLLHGATAINDPNQFSKFIGLVVGCVALGTTIACSVYGKKMVKMIPFVIGIGAGYLVATIFTIIGKVSGNDQLLIIDFSKFNHIAWLPDFTFVTAFKGFKDLAESGKFLQYLLTITSAYVPVAFVVFAEHIADHKNLSSIIEKDLLEDPGLSNTLLGDGVGSMAGAFFGGCPNTTYGESVGCVAISGNASIVTIFTTAIMAILISFFGPFSTFLSTIPNCVMGGVCIALYGFISVSGLKMLQGVDLNDNTNLFVVSVILIVGVGTKAAFDHIALQLGTVTIDITAVAFALFLGILTNLLCKKARKSASASKEVEEAKEPEQAEATNE